MSQMAEVLTDFDPEEFYRTNDMSMATYLKLRGFDLQTTMWRSGTCYWVFRVTDALLDCVEDYTAGEARVDPKEYNRVFTQTKREFYDSKNARSARAATR